MTPERVLGGIHVTTHLVSYTRIFTILLQTLWLTLSWRLEKCPLQVFLTCLCNYWHRTSSLLDNIRVSRAGQCLYLKPEQRWSEGHRECGAECSRNYKRNPEEPLFIVRAILDPRWKPGFPMSCRKLSWGADILTQNPISLVISENHRLSMEAL